MQSKKRSATMPSVTTESRASSSKSLPRILQLIIALLNSPWAISHLRAHTCTAFYLRAYACNFAWRMHSLARVCHSKFRLPELRDVETEPNSRFLLYQRRRQRRRGIREKKVFQASKNGFDAKSRWKSNLVPSRGCCYYWIINLNSIPRPPKVKCSNPWFYDHLDGLQEEFELLTDEFISMKKQKDKLEATSTYFT